MTAVPFSLLCYDTKVSLTKVKKTVFRVSSFYSLFSSSQLHLQEALPNVLWQHIKGNDYSAISGETTVTQSAFTTPKQISTIFCCHCHHRFCRFLMCVHLCEVEDSCWMCLCLSKNNFCYRNTSCQFMWNSYFRLWLLLMYSRDKLSHSCVN